MYYPNANIDPNLLCSLLLELLLVLCVFVSDSVTVRRLRAELWQPLLLSSFAIERELKCSAEQYTSVLKTILASCPERNRGTYNAGRFTCKNNAGSYPSKMGHVLA
jgi:hypothetical protein